MRGNVVWAVLEKKPDKNGSTMRIVELGLSEKEAKETAKLLSRGGTEYVAAAMKLGVDYGHECN